MKQVMFYDKENDMRHGGILTDDGDIICGCCGGLIPADEIDDDIVILEVFDFWVNLDEEICGDDFFVDESYTAFLIVDDMTEDMATYDSKKEAIEFAKKRNWNEVVNDITGEVVWGRNDDSI